MRKLIVLIAALAASLGLYVAVFSVVHRPLTLGDIPRQLEFKARHAAALPSPKLIVFAGSNGRYSHRCADIAAPLGLPCTNLSIGVGIGLDFLLEQVRPLLHPGDIVYMPLEYSQYAVTRDEMDAGLHNATLVHDLRGQLMALPARRIVQAHGYFDLSFLIQGMVEMALDAGGFQRRTSLASLTPEGDEQGHSAQAALAYREFLGRAVHAEVTVPEDSHAIRVLREFLAQARASGVVVVAGLPTAPDNVAVPDEVVARLRSLYEQAGHRFIVLDHRSRYPLDCFYDTLSHLHEDCQRRHSAEVGRALARALRADAPEAP